MAEEQHRGEVEGLEKRIRDGVTLFYLERSKVFLSLKMQ